ncbi:MAG: chorismate mutase [Actinobacteria bacterium]|nr:chorismate mutase [Actinomycetota bacterium]
MTGGPLDPIESIRTRLTELDERIVETLNRRLELVTELRRVKAARGLGFLDPAREEWLRSHLETFNRGPLSADGLNELVSDVLALMKREVERERS